MREYKVSGMSCAACSANVEKAVKRVSGVTSCNVNLLTGSMQVEGEVSEQIIMNAVKNAGYSASVPGEQKEDKEEEDGERKELSKRLLFSILFLLPLMYLSMGHTMWNFPLPATVAGNPLLQGLLQLLFTVPVLLINRRFFINGVKGLLNRAPNMDTLVSLGAGASFLYSFWVFFQMQVLAWNGDKQATVHQLHNLYFESAAMILTLITVGKLLEAYSKGKTTTALKALMKLAPKTAILWKEGEESEIEIEKLQVGDFFCVKPGMQVPADGIIRQGEGAVDESMLTGESIPVDKGPEDRVSAGTINQSGHLICEATGVGENTALSQIIKMVNDAASSKAPIAKVADRVSGIFVPVVTGIALLTFFIWIFMGESFSFSLTRAVSVLVISCPCALGLATPVAIMVGNGVAARQGILFKTAEALEETGKIQIAVMDKTGTITKGEPEVTDVYIAGEKVEKNLWETAISLEKKSEHPLAKAILEAGKEKKISPLEVEEFMVKPGNGLSGYINGISCLGGNRAFLEAHIFIEDEAVRKAEVFAEEGKTPLFFAENKELLGIIAVADVIREESTEAILALKQMGIKTVMLTGDHKKTAEAMAKRSGVDEVISEVLPGDKEKVVQKLREKAKVAMIGDGMNDAPALTSADVGIAIGTGTDISRDAADVVLIKSNLMDVQKAIRISKATLRNIHENLFWAFFYNMVGIPLAAGAFIPRFGLTLNPMFGAAAMSLSSFCVVTNALRLNLLYKNENKDKTERKGKENMKQVEMKITGMMCGHCEARVKKVLESMEGVKEVQVSHEKGIATLKVSENMEDSVLKEAVEKEDYQVTEIISTL